MTTEISIPTTVELRSGKDVEWDDRVTHLATVLKDAHTLALVTEYLNHRASGLATKEFLDRHQVTWPDLQKLLWPVWEFVKYADTLGTAYRFHLAEDELHRRAVEGNAKPVYQGKELVGHIQEYSDGLLALILKSGNPDKYADRQKVEHTGVQLNINVDGVNH
jgi:hypothetical protein